eukprot:scaffold96631_cov44-Phaeocystis_antarctica.AAC.1
MSRQASLLPQMPELKPSSTPAPFPPPRAAPGIRVPPRQSRQSRQSRIVSGAAPLPPLPSQWQS